MSRTFVKPVLIGVATLAMSTGLSGYVWQEEHRPHILEVYVFALKSGRSIFIRTPEDKRILVDGGANSEIIRELTAILPFYSRRIDLVVATNSEGKNVSGLIDVINRYHVGRVFIPAITVESLGLASSSDQIYATFEETAKTISLPVQAVHSGQSFNLDGKTTLDIVFPWLNMLEDASTSSATSTFSYSKASAPEVLFRIRCGQTALVFLGSASSKVQKYIAVEHEQSLKADALIVSHSALPDSLAAALMNKIKPAYLVYSKDTSVKAAPSSTKTSSKKPAKKPIDPLAYIDAKHRYNLKEWGSIKIVSDGLTVSVSAAK